jgi:polyphosphate kinase
MSTGSLTSTDLDEQDAASVAASADARDATPDETGAEAATEAAEVSSFTSTVPNRRIPARAPNGRFVGAGAQGDDGDDLPADRYLERELTWLQFN